MPDEMFFTDDYRSLRRGRRKAPRTETCRPCLVWPVNSPEVELQGVAMDLCPYGMLVRALGSLPVGTQVKVQLMRDEDFREPLAGPVQGMVVRNTPSDEGFTDHGIQLDQPQTVRTPPNVGRPTGVSARPPQRPIETPGFDYTVEDTAPGTGGIRRSGR